MDLKVFWYVAELAPSYPFLLFYASILLVNYDIKSIGLTLSFEADEYNDL